MFCKMTRSTFIALALVFGLSQSGGAYAQDTNEEDSLAQAHEQLKSVLDSTDNVFYKSGKQENGTQFYTVIWEFDKKSVKFIATLNKLGFYNGKDIYSISFWTYVVDGETSVPPAVIKAVATANDRLTLGNISCSQDFTKVYANITASLEGLTPGSMWLYAAYMASNVEGMKAIIEEATAGSGR